MKSALAHNGDERKKQPAQNKNLCKRKASELDSCCKNSDSSLLRGGGMNAQGGSGAQEKEGSQNIVRLVAVCARVCLCLFVCFVLFACLFACLFCLFVLFACVFVESNQNCGR